MLIAYAKCSHVSRDRGGRVVVLVSFIFQFCIAKRLAICKFEGLINIECYTFKTVGFW